MCAMSYRTGISRQQTMLLPASVEDYVSAENPARAIDAFVEGLDLEEIGFELKGERSVGASGYHPKALLKLYLYGYLNRVRSSRELEKATHRNLEVIWLLRCLTPDHWTINEFRREHRKLFRGVFRQFHLVCASLGLFGGELVAIDGAFFKAVNSPERNFTKGKVQKIIQEIDQRTEDYLKKLETTDPDASEQSIKAGKGKEAEKLQTRLKELEEKRRECTAILKKLTEEPSGQLSLTDPDSRALRKRAERTVGYNVQIAVDEKHHLIAAEAVTLEGNDSCQLAPMAKAAKEALEVEKLAAVADRGYWNASGIRECAQEGIETYVPEQRHTAAGNGEYPNHQFKYDPERDLYLCPKGKELLRSGETTRDSIRYFTYSNRKACSQCPVRSNCTRGKYRTLNVHEFHADAEAARTRVRENSGMMARRRALAEHPFGTMKFWWGYRSFLTRGLEMVAAEFTLGCLAYNFRRAINLVGIADLIKGVQGAV